MCRLASSLSLPSYIPVSYTHLDDLGEGFYLIDIVSFKKVNGKYTLILGQENESVKQAVFTSENLTKGWKFLEIREEKIHTVG